MDLTNLRRKNDDRAWADLQEEARIANDLQRDHPDITRTEALKAARDLVEKVNKARG